MDQLLDMYYRSVGRNCNLLLNANPNPEGLVPEADFQRYVEFGQAIRRRFEKPIAETRGQGPVVELTFDRPEAIDHLILMEDIAHGERIRKYEVTGLLPSHEWQTLCTGISVGHKRIERFTKIKISKIRLHVTESVARPLIRKLAAYDTLRE